MKDIYIGVRNKKLNLFKTSNQNNFKCFYIAKFLIYKILIINLEKLS